MPKMIVAQKLPEPAKDGSWYSFDNLEIEYDSVELIDVLSIMDKLELEYQDPDDRWWKLRAEMAGQKYAITKRALDATKCPDCNGDLNERGNCSQCHTLYPSRTDIALANRRAGDAHSEQRS